MDLGKSCLGNLLDSLWLFIISNKGSPETNPIKGSRKGLLDIFGLTTSAGVANGREDIVVSEAVIAEGGCTRCRKGIGGV